MIDAGVIATVDPYMGISLRLLLLSASVCALLTAIAGRLRMERAAGAIAGEHAGAASMVGPAQRATAAERVDCDGARSGVRRHARPPLVVPAPGRDPRGPPHGPRLLPWLFGRHRGRD